jgi:hypothetical protein
MHRGSFEFPVYDLVLIVPFVQHFATVIRTAPQLTIYVGVLV